MIQTFLRYGYDIDHQNFTEKVQNSVCSFFGNQGSIKGEKDLLGQFRLFQASTKPSYVIAKFKYERRRGRKDDDEVDDYRMIQDDFVRQHFKHF